MVEDHCPEWECRVRLFILLKRNGGEQRQRQKAKFCRGRGGGGVRGRGRDRKPNFVAFSA